MQRQELMRKIRALLALARNNPSVEESMAALKKARDLMDAHNLTENDVEIERSRTLSAGRKWIRVIASGAAQVNGCLVIRSVGNTARLQFAGKSVNVEVTIEMFRYLVKAVRRSLPKGSNNQLFALSVLLASRLIPWCNHQEEIDRIKQALQLRDATVRAKKYVRYSPRLHRIAQSINVSRQAEGGERSGISETRQIEAQTN